MSKVKVFLCSIKHDVMKLQGEWRYSASALDRGEWLASFLSLLWTRIGLGMVAKRKVPVPTRIEPRSSSLLSSNYSV
jgi:hypothetical protein